MNNLLEGLKKEDLDMLLKCINGQIRSYDAGTEGAGDDLLEAGTCDSFLIIDGVAEYIDKNDNKVAVSSGNAGINAKTITIQEDSSVLFFDFRKGMEPCWFGCSFHWKFTEYLFGQKREIQEKIGE